MGGGGGGGSGYIGGVEDGNTIAGNQAMHLWNSTTSGGTMIGNNNDGHARIYWIG
jgi:hypothetical protein